MAATRPTGGESVSERIRDYNDRVKQIAKESYPEVARTGEGGFGGLTLLRSAPDCPDLRADPGRPTACKGRDLGRTDLLMESRRYLLSFNPPAEQSPRRGCILPSVYTTPSNP
jgi:hypothetical protein